MSPQEVSTDFVYFVQERRAGSFLIKIAATGDCPYLRLEQLRRERRKDDPYSRFELLGIIDLPHSDNQTCGQAKHQLQSRFENLRDRGDWFRPGLELVQYIREHARLHICGRLCPQGPAVEEAMRELDRKASEAMQSLL
jgi:hypothetical protein